MSQQCEQVESGPLNYTPALRSTPWHRCNHRCHNCERCVFNPHNQPDFDPSTPGPSGEPTQYPALRSDVDRNTQDIVLLKTKTVQDEEESTAKIAILNDLLTEECTSRRNACESLRQLCDRLTKEIEELKKNGSAEIGGSGRPNASLTEQISTSQTRGQLDQTRAAGQSGQAEMDAGFRRQTASSTEQFSTQREQVNQAVAATAGTSSRNGTVAARTVHFTTIDRGLFNAKYVRMRVRDELEVPLFQIDGWTWIGDGISSQIMRHAFERSLQTSNVLKQSPLNDPRNNLRQLYHALLQMSEMPKKIVISCGQADSIAKTGNAQKIGYSIGAIIALLEKSRVEQVVLLPPVTFENMPVARASLVELLSEYTPHRHNMRITYAKNVQQWMWANPGKCIIPRDGQSYIRTNALHEVASEVVKTLNKIDGK